MRWLRADDRAEIGPPCSTTYTKKMLSDLRPMPGLKEPTSGQRILVRTERVQLRDEDLLIGPIGPFLSEMDQINIWGPPKV